jgi:2-C-methyl-D-erythritol 4-phosphate cytidylyltransferase/2-C-methyl-D-erythritol 2,4-cyclodiphosphate synthase
MNHVIILAAGQGQRMKMKDNKMLVKAGGRPLIYYSLMVFNDHPEINSISVVANKNNKLSIKKIIETYKFTKAKYLSVGGLTRQKSLENGLIPIRKTAKGNDIIIVHNGANPLPSHEEISKVIALAEEHGACISGHFISSTLKEINRVHVIQTHDRKKFFLAETPQAAKYSILKKAINSANKSKFLATDEAMLLENIGQKVAYTEVSEENFKITTQQDYFKLKTILGDVPDDFRVGIGQDSHVFEDKKNGLTLAGIYFPNEKKLEANSDGDVVLHAIFNALSQATGDRSLGFYADEEFKKGITDSKKYLEIILKKIKKDKFHINSVGLMIECKTPKIDPIADSFKKSLSQILSVNPTRIGVTATSGENATIFGAGFGIQCFAIVSLKKDK